MNNLNNILNEIKNGNKKVIKDLVLTTRLYVLNTVRSIVNNDELAVSVAEEIYSELLLNAASISDNQSFFDYLNDLIYSKTDKHIKQVTKLKRIKETKQVVDLTTINIDDYKDYYNNPKVEKIIYATINSLPEAEKAIIIDNYFFGMDEESLAKKYNTSTSVINSYISKANNLIEKKSKPLFISNKIINADYSGVALIYSTIQLSKNVMTFDLLGIAADVIEKQFEDEEDEEDKKTLPSFIKDIIKDYIKDWFLDRIRSAIVTGVAVASATGAAVTQASKVVGVSIVKKIVIGTVVAGLFAAGGTIAYNVSKNTYDNKVAEVYNITPSFNTEGSYNDIPFEINVYADEENPNVVKSLYLDVNVENKKLSPTKLNLIEAASKAVSGFDFYSAKGDDNTTIHVVVNKDELNENLIEFVKSLNVINADIIEKAELVLNADKNELQDLLNEFGISSN